MNWRDLLYFSKGERNALTLLLCLISISWIILLLTDNKPEQLPTEKNQAIEPTKTTQSITPNKPEPKQVKAAAPQRKNEPSPKKKESRPPKSPNIPGRKAFPKTEKYSIGTVVELNTADTTSLKKIPGIGSAFARRIIKYRDLLGGFYSVSQLCEVYGIEQELYNTLESWFSVDASCISKLFVNRSSVNNLYRHPYINNQQARTIEQIRKQKRNLSGWNNLLLLDEFTEADKERLTPYLSFE